MKNKTLLTGAVLTTLVGANTFSQDRKEDKTIERQKLSSLSCSIDSKVRSNIKNQIRAYGKDNSAIIEIETDCRHTTAKDGKTTNWEKKTMYIDIKTAKSIQRNPDANEIVSTKGSRYIQEAGSYVMNNSTYQLKANFNGKNHDVENNDDLYGAIKDNLKEVPAPAVAKSTKKEKKDITSHHAKKKAEKEANKDVASKEKKEKKETLTVAKKEQPKKEKTVESRIVKEVKRWFRPKKDESNASNVTSQPKSTAKDADKLNTSFGTKEGDYEMVNGKPKLVKPAYGSQKEQKVEEKKPVNLPKKPSSKKQPTDNEIDNIIKNAGKKYS